MTKQDIIDYVVMTPHNTNKAVLSSMLDQMTSDSGDGGISVVTIPVTNIFPEGFEPMEDATSCTSVITIGGKEFFNANLIFDDSLEAVMVDNCRLVNFVSYGAGWVECTVESVIATGGVSWDAESFVATVTGEGTMTIIWKYTN